MDKARQDFLMQKIGSADGGRKYIHEQAKTYRPELTIDDLLFIVRTLRTQNKPVWRELFDSVSNAVSGYQDWTYLALEGRRAPYIEPSQKKVYLYTTHDMAAEAAEKFRAAGIPVSAIDFTGDYIRSISFMLSKYDVKLCAVNDGFGGLVVDCDETLGCAYADQLWLENRDFNSLCVQFALASLTKDYNWAYECAELMKKELAVRPLRYMPAKDDAAHAQIENEGTENQCVCVFTNYYDLVSVYEDRRGECKKMLLKDIMALAPNVNQFYLNPYGCALNLRREDGWC